MGYRVSTTPLGHGSTGAISAAQVTAALTVPGERKDVHLLQLESGKKRGLSWLDEEIARRRRAEEQKEKHGDTEVIPDDPAAQFLLGLSCWASDNFFTNLWLHFVTFAKFERIVGRIQFA